jgi:hypothetical protein
MSVLWAAGFFGPALWQNPRAWPVPLDDVYIHFDFARSFALGQPMHWIAGQGYSSGETAPLYAAVLGVGYLFGFRGPYLAGFALLLGLGAAYVFMRAVASLFAGPRRGLFVWAPLPVCATGWLGFCWWSGMELSLFGAALGVAFAAAAQASDPRALGPHAAQRTARARFAWACAAMVLLRPEAVVLVAALSVPLLIACKDASVWRRGTVLLLPAVTCSLGIGLLHRAYTGSFQAAGAQLKLLSSNPYLTGTARSKELITNALMFKWRIVDQELVTARTLLLVPAALVLAALWHQRSRALGTWSLVGAALFAALVSYNGAARYQNYRYYVPAALLVALVAALGAAALARKRRGAWFAAGLLGIWAVGASCAAPKQVQFFVQASANIAAQHVPTAAFLRQHTKPDAILLVGDAGALPYLSERHAIDALGLGGYHGFPFVKAAPHGEASMLEMMEHVPGNQRPTHLALYANWFPITAEHFGRKLWSVTIDHNVICGGTTKGVYEADWSALGAAGERLPMFANAGAAVAELDVADVLSETAGGYAPTACSLGFTRADLRNTGTGTRFDGGRILAPECGHTFRVPGRGTETALYTRFIGDDDAIEIEGATASQITRPCADCWALQRVALPAGTTWVRMRARKFVTVHHHWVFER